MMIKKLHYFFLNLNDLIQNATKSHSLNDHAGNCMRIFGHTSLLKTLITLAISRFY